MSGPAPEVRKLLYPSLAVVLVVAWQYLTVSVNYDGDWTALFCTGAKFGAPPGLSHEDIYLFPNSYGYDGQFYHYIAHDPFFRSDIAGHIDAPRLRYRRILLPVLAYLLAGGQQRWIDTGYLLVTLVFLFAGVCWVSLYAVRHGHHPAWGLGFLLLPASVTSIDRLTVDLALASLCAGFVVLAERPPSWRIVALLTAAAFARETGLLLIAAYGLYLGWRHQWRWLTLSLMSAVPGLAWYIFVHLHTAPEDFPNRFVPLAGMIGALVHPSSYDSRVPYVPLIQALDIVALLGMLLAFVLTVIGSRRQPLNPVTLAALMFTGLGVFLQREDMWIHVMNYGRVFMPVVLFLAMGYFCTRRRLYLLPVLLMAPRLGAQLGGQLKGVAAAVLDG